MIAPVTLGRAALVAELEAYVPTTQRERAMVDEVIAFVRAHADCFERTQVLGHITASAWIVDPARTHALLTHHRKLDRWLQLGGHADGDFDVRRVARREATEESGLADIALALTGVYDVDVHEIPARGAEPAHKHYDIRFAFIADACAPLVLSEESHALAWRPISSLTAESVDESVRRLAEKTIQLSDSRS
ncbi:MAG: NUDIX hydrolase [Candidatus Velthaea sp.]